MVSVLVLAANLDLDSELELGRLVHEARMAEVGVEGEGVDDEEEIADAVGREVDMAGAVMCFFAESEEVEDEGE